MPLIWATPPTIWATNFERYAQLLDAALLALSDFFAPQIEAWMKENASWTDRTGNARQTLHAESFKALNEIGIVISHGMDYGLWLELANGGRYSILSLALDYWGPRFFEAVRRLVA
jgi:hypothetical protein